MNGNRTADERGGHEFNSRDQLVKWTADEDDGGAVTSYTLNGSGQIDVQRTSGTGGAPGSVTDNSYDYDDEGERLKFSETRSSDADPDAGDGTRTSYEYDPGGLGEVTRQSTGGQAPVTYSYDEFGRQTGSDNGQGKLDSYTHDGLDRRDTKATEGKTFDMSYIGSSESLSQEQQFGGTETRSYDYDAQMDRLGMDRQGVAGLDANGYRAFSKDANGSVEGLENENGDVPEDDKYSYDPYGALTAPQGQTGDTGGGGTGGATGGIGGVGTGAGTGGQPPDNEPTGEAAKANPFRFQGHYYDTGVKTYDMQARPYSPQAGRFLTEDRYESAAGDLSLETDALTQDRYSFAGGNPINNIEYDGHEPNGSFNPNGRQSIRGGDGKCYRDCGDGDGSSQPPARLPSTSDDYSTHAATPSADGGGTSGDSSPPGRHPSSIPGRSRAPSSDLNSNQGYQKRSPGFPAACASDCPDGFRPQFDPVYGAPGGTFEYDPATKFIVEQALTCGLAPEFCLPNLGRKAGASIGSKLLPKILGGSDDATKVGAASLDDLSQAAASPARGGQTAAGRALQKHGDRAGSSYPRVTSPAERSRIGQDIVDDYLTHPQARERVRRDGTRMFELPDGRGVSFNTDGSLRGLLEPRP